MNPATVWDLPFDMWRMYAAAHDQQVKESGGG